MNKQDTINQLEEIRSLMERSTRFLSLSGLSGVSAGIIALAGAAFAFFHLDYNIRYFDINEYFNSCLYRKFSSSINLLLLDGIVTLAFAASAILFFTIRRARKQGHKVWDQSAKRVLYHLLVPLATGGLFCIILLYHGIIFLIGPATLVFYGLALINAGKFTLPDIQYLGISEIVLGLLSCFFVGYGLLFWAIGFGLLHIVYGSVMYFKYERS